MPPIFTVEKREEIHTTLLEAGTKLLKEKGAQKMSVDEVAKLAGIGKGTFYHFFSSKEQFLQKIIQFNKQELYRRIQQMGLNEGGITKENFRALLIEFSFFSKNNILYYINAEDALWLQKKLPEEYGLHSEKEEHIIHTILSWCKGIREGIDPYVIANLMKIMGIAAENRANLYEEALSETMEQMMEILLNYMFE